MKRLFISILLLLFCTAAFAQTKYQIADDGFPTGRNTPEGTACDAVRAYIYSDHELWLSLLVPPIYAEHNTEYHDFKEMMVAKKKQNAQNPNFPKMKIVTVYKARNFSLNGPGSLAFALLKYTGNMFVDILVDVGNGQVQGLRYQVMRDEGGTWYFNPRPDLSYPFSMGLNEETESTRKWK